MSYTETKRLMENRGVTAEEVGDIISSYAAELQKAEPHAESSVSAAMETADAFRFDLDE